MGGRWSVKPSGKIDGGRILGRDPGGEEGEDLENDDEDDAYGGERIVPGIAGDAATEGDGKSGHERNINFYAVLRLPASCVLIEKLRRARLACSRLDL